MPTLLFLLLSPIFLGATILIFVAEWVASLKRRAV